tara:strand:+ start:4191 stop:5060 length:870 start_codon:yes stop_codon:yes gene_type:complete
VNGLLLIDKPKGITSASCVYQLRKLFRIKKIGHCGTLDPIATGLLPICIGEATKFSSYLSDLDKTYEVEISFGVETDTGDVDGEIISRGINNFNKTDLVQVLKSFECSQLQIPPMYSALKIQGKPLYWWARKGVFLIRKEREIKIQKIDLLNFGNDLVKLKVSCTKGTYIRTLAESIGKALHTKATVFSLRRLSIGDISSKDMVSMPKEGFSDISSSLLPSDFLLKHLSKATLGKEDVKKVRNGQSIYYNAQLEKKGLVRIYTNKSLFMGIGELNSSNKLSPRRLIAIN